MGGMGCKCIGYVGLCGVGFMGDIWFLDCNDFVCMDWIFWCDFFVVDGVWMIVYFGLFDWLWGYNDEFEFYWIGWNYLVFDLFNVQ